MNRAYSIVEVKAVDDEKRIISGLATTPAPDRIGDVVEPMGAKFNIPLPLLWQHQADMPVGQVTAAKPNKKGIPFTARIAKIDEPGELKNIVDKAWQAVKANLVRGVSIGFRSLEHNVMEDGGWRFIDWEWLELSLVTIPANAEATIETIKQYDTGNPTASGKDAREHPPGVSGRHKSVKLEPKEGRDMSKTISEQLAALEATRAAKAARMEAIMKKAGDEGRSTDEAEQEEFDGLEPEVLAIDRDIKRLRSLERTIAGKAKEVGGSVEGDGARRGSVDVRVKGPKLAPGIRFARIAKCIALAKTMGQTTALGYAEGLYPNDEETVLYFKTNVPGGATLSGNWAANLVGEETSAFADFVEWLRPQTILGRFGAGGIPALRRVPFRVPLIGQTSGGSGYWVGEGKAKPLTKFSFERSTLQPLKCANICVATMELLRDSSPAAEALLRDQLSAALAETMDMDFIDPANGGTPGSKPVSITNALTPISSSGVSADAVRTDVQAIMQAFINANNPLTSGVWIMSSGTALVLSLMRNALGQPEFPGITPAGGTFMGLPVITSEYIPTDTSGSVIVLANASDVYFGDDGGIAVDMSREASLEMDDGPSSNVTSPTESSLVSMWQTNSVAFKAERTINWALRRATGVQMLDGVLYSVNGT